MSFFIMLAIGFTVGLTVGYLYGTREYDDAVRRCPKTGRYLKSKD